MTKPPVLRALLVRIAALKDKEIPVPRELYEQCVQRARSDKDSGALVFAYRNWVSELMDERKYWEALSLAQGALTEASGFALLHELRAKALRKCSEQLITDLALNGNTSENRHALTRLQELCRCNIHHYELAYHLGILEPDRAAAFERLCPIVLHRGEPFPSRLLRQEQGFGHNHDPEGLQLRVLEWLRYHSLPLGSSEQEYLSAIETTIGKMVSTEIDERAVNHYRMLVLTGHDDLDAAVKFVNEFAENPKCWLETRVVQHFADRLEKLSSSNVEPISLLATIQGIDCPSISLIARAAARLLKTERVRANGIIQDLRLLVGDNLEMIGAIVDSSGELPETMGDLLEGFLSQVTAMADRMPFDFEIAILMSKLKSAIAS